MLRLSPASQSVWLLGLTQVIGYGSLYYSFAIVADQVAAEFAISNSLYFAIFSAALVAGGLVMPAAGRAYDLRGAVNVLAIGSCASGVSLAAVALAPNVIVFALAMVAVQVASSLVLYDAAFTALVQAHSKEGGKRIVHLTLIAGFASSVSWPFTQWLDDGFGWRVTLLIYAALNVFACGPVHLLLVGLMRPSRQETDEQGALNTEIEQDPPLAPHQARTVLWLSTWGFALSGMALTAVISQMVPLLQALGFGAASLVISTLFGPAQVVVRFTNLVFGASTHPLRLTIFAMALLPLAFVVVGFSAPLVAGGVVFAILMGMASGLKSIVQGTLPLALLGSEGYGARQGFMSSFRYVLGALAPFAFALAAEVTDTRMASFIFAAVGALGVACFLAIATLLRKAVAT